MEAAHNHSKLFPTGWRFQRPRCHMSSRHRVVVSTARWWRQVDITLEATANMMSTGSEQCSDINRNIQNGGVLGKNCYCLHLLVYSCLEIYANPTNPNLQNFSCFYMGSPCRTPIRVKVRDISWALFTDRNRKHLKPGTLQSLLNNKFHEFKDIKVCFLTKNLLDVCEIEVSSPTMPCWRVNTRLRLKGQNQDWFWLSWKKVLGSNNW